MPTNIEWAEETWNPITGCTKISEGCKNCYAERMAKRLAGRYGYPKDEPFRPGTVHHDKMSGLYLEKICKSGRVHATVFVCSMGDLFHEAVNSDDIQSIFLSCTIYDATKYLFLTKRPERMKEEIDIFVEKRASYGCVLPIPQNMWFGITAENQQAFDYRAFYLKQIPATIRFISIEPMLGPIDMRGYLTRPQWGEPDENDLQPLEIVPRNDLINWVICGGESGPGARPMHPDWVRSLRDQCIEVGVPFLFKQWGHWAGFYSFPPGSGLLKSNVFDLDTAQTPFGVNGPYAWPVGKKKSGRLLDGDIWDQYPNQG